MKIYKCKVPTGENGVFGIWEALFLRKPSIEDICNALAEEIKKWETLKSPPLGTDLKIWEQLDTGQRKFAERLREIADNIKDGRLEPFISEREVIAN